MERLKNLMELEYAAMSEMGIIPPVLKEVKAFLKAKLSEKDFDEIENKLTDIHADSEWFGFEQGFARGILAAKGGAV